MTNKLVNYNRVRNQIKKYLEGKIPDQWIYPMTQDILEIVKKAEGYQTEDNS